MKKKKTRGRHALRVLGVLVILLGLFYCYRTWQLNSDGEVRRQQQAVFNDPHLIQIEGQEFEVEEPAYLIGDVVMVPLRELFESAGADVVFHPYREQAVATFQDTEVAVRLDQRHALIDKSPYRMERPSMVIEGSMYVPLDLAEEIL